MLGVSPLFRPEFVPSAQKTGSAVVIDGQTAGRQGRLGGRLRTTAGHPDESGCGTYEYVRHNIEPTFENEDDAVASYAAGRLCR